MAASRKLQGEIDRCLKKVSEGVDTFDDIWKKVHNATNNNQKEKYEADLKKEIKKLQRLRDQIKSWIASAEIKDKSQLLDHRKLIETQMERFKVVERETKTKAYSKEGLGAAQKLDPATKEREEISAWLVTSIDALNLQTNQLEFELEHLSGGKKKKLDRDKQERSDEYKSRLERHRFHTQKLETLLRMLDNLSVEVDQIKKIKEDVEYYIESSQEPGFQENEYLYDDISGLDEVELSGNLPPSADNILDNETPNLLNSNVSPVPSPAHSVTLSNHSNDAIVNSSDVCTDKRKKDDLSKVIKPVAIKTANTNTNSISTTLTNNYNHHLLNKQPLHMNTVSNFTSSTTAPATATATPLSILVSTTSSISTISSSMLTSAPSSTLSSVSTLASASAAAIAAASLSLSATSSSTITTSTPFVPISIMSSRFNQTPNNSSSSSGVIHHSSIIGPGIGNFAAVAAANTAQSSKYSTLENGPISTTTNSSLNSSTSNSAISSSTHLAAQLMNQQHSNLHNANVFHASNLTNLSSLSHANPVSQNSQPNLKPLMSDQQSNSRNLLTNSSTANNSNLSLMNGAITNSATINHTLQSSTFTPSNEKMTSLKTIAQQAIDRAGIELSTLNSNCSNNHNNTSNVNIKINNGLHTSTNDQTKSLLNSSTSTMACNRDPNSIMTLSKFDTTNNNSVSTAIIANSSRETLSQTGEAFISPLLGVAPLGIEPLSKENQLQFQRLETAFYHIPNYFDTEKNRPLFQRNPYHVPDYYIQPPYTHMCSADYYQSLGTETLFFIFYFMEGTKAQYFAARALKKQSWRFHTKYMMWFQRHEEPKAINDDYEQGTYIYFDYEKWAQRKKDGFTFEYKYLEDRDLN